MPVEFVIDLVEAQEGITYITGLSLQALKVGDSFSNYCVYLPAAKKKQAPKLEEKSAISLKTAVILIQGEPQDSISAETSAQIGLEGDISPLISLLEAHKWHKNKGRYQLARNENRIITLAGD